MNQLTKFLVDGILNEGEQRVIAAYGGGFKPPTSGHFEVVKQALKNHPEIDEFIIYVGSGTRDGITQAESVLIWEIYQTYLPMKVKIEPSKAPIGDILRLGKNNPQDKVYFVLGAREENEGDFEDIKNRTKAIGGKHPNVEVKVITTMDKGMSGTNARKAAKVSFEDFAKFLPTELSDDEKEIVYNIVKPVVKESLNKSFYLDIPKFNQPKTIQQYLIENIKEISLSKENAVDINGDLTGGTFTVGDITYEYSIKNIPNPYKDLGLFYNIQFTPKGEVISIPKGGKENYIKILSTMYKIIVDFIEKEQPEYVGISSLDNSGGKNYHTVYNRLTTNNLNLIPGYFRKDSNLIFDSPQGKGRFIVLKRKESLNENASYSQDIDIKQRIMQLTQHMLDKGMNIEPLPNVKFVDGDNVNAREFLGKTAYYDPNSATIVLYTEGRHPKDIVRSFSHEMIHHIQNLEGRLGNITTTNTQEDDKLNNIEAEANLKGTMTFRNWTDSLNEVKKEVDNSMVAVSSGDGHQISLYDFKNKEPLGLINTYENAVTGVVAKKGYGPLMYELGMANVYPNSLQSDRNGNTEPEAQAVWDKFIQGASPNIKVEKLTPKDKEYRTEYPNGNEIWDVDGFYNYKFYNPDTSTLKNLLKKGNELYPDEQKQIILSTKEMYDNTVNEAIVGEKIEQEANLRGTMTFRNWTDSLDGEEVTSLNEDLSDVSLDYIKTKLPKLDSYPKSDIILSKGDFTYINIPQDKDFGMTAEIKAFDQKDGTLVAQSSFDYDKNGKLKGTLDVRPDKRRLGIATEIYKLAEKIIGDTIFPEEKHTEDAEKFWQQKNRSFGPKTDDTLNEKNKPYKHKPITKEILFEEEDKLMVEVVNPDGERFEYEESNIKGLYTYKDSLDNLYFARITYSPSSPPRFEFKVGWFEDNDISKPKYDPQLPPNTTSMDDLKRRNTVAKIYRDEILPYLKDNQKLAKQLDINPISQSRYIFSQRLIQHHTPSEYNIDLKDRKIVISLPKIEEKKNKDPFGLNAYALELAKGLEEDPDTKARLKRGLDYITKRKEASKKKTQRLKKQKTNENLNGETTPKMSFEERLAYYKDYYINVSPSTFDIMTEDGTIVIGGLDKPYSPNFDEKKDVRQVPVNENVPDAEDDGKAAPYGSGYKKINEGRYDTLANQLSKIAFQEFKDIHDRGDEEGTFKFRVDHPDEEHDIPAEEFYFDFEGIVKITDDEYNVDGGANVGFDDKGDEITPILSVKFKIPKNPDWQKVSFDIKDVVRHELEHLTQDGDNEKGGAWHEDPRLRRPSKYIQDDQFLRDMIDANLLPKSDYFKLEKEVDAMLQGMYFKAKKSKTPFKKVLNDYLDIFVDQGSISKEEKENILDVWRSRRKALSLPSF